MIVRSATNKLMPSAQNIVNELLSSCNVSVSAQTVRNGLHSAGLKARTPRKKPYISEVKPGKDVREERVWKSQERVCHCQGYTVMLLNYSFLRSRDNILNELLLYFCLWQQAKKR
ncbi:hypothetical protein TNCV_3562201 [Trichonephila clavipes]|nr:hypothetical protein TNCV_3562201 [Trichonephila clavipes]